jgi:hypothetical protein
MPIDRSKWKENYETGTARSGGKLVDNYIAKSGKAAAMASDSAQKNFEAAMTDKKVLQRRQLKLKKVSEEDLNEAMRVKGSARYVEGTAAGVDKAAANVEPFLGIIDSEVAKLKPRTRDAYTNVVNRVAPIAVALQKKKESMT